MHFPCCHTLTLPATRLFRLHNPALLYPAPIFFILPIQNDRVMNTASINPAFKSRIRAARGKFACMAASYTLGTFNDNFYKQAALILAVEAGRTSMQGYALAAFTIPFIVLAAPAGWMADRFAKRRVVIGAKTVELLAMLAGALGVCLGNWTLIFVMLTTMGIQAAFFSPAMNGSLPELYPESYVPRANAILRMLVTLAILAGVALAGVALDRPGEWRGIGNGRVAVSAVVIGVALAGLLVSLGVPRRTAANPGAPYPWTGPIHTCRHIAGIWRDRLLAVTVLADVFIWLTGSVGILVINPLGLDQFGLSKTMTSVLVATQLAGIGVGGLAAGRFVRGPHWHRIVAPGGAAMSAVMIAMVLTPHAPPALRLPLLIGLLFLLGVTGGVILIPVESFLQVRPAPHEKGSVLASVNFVVFAGILLSGFIANGLNALCRPTTAFVCLGLGSLAASAWLFRAYRKEEATSCSSN